MKEDFGEELKNKHDENFTVAGDEHKSCCGPKDAAQTILGMTGEDLSREGLIRTPDRFVKAYKDLFSGYSLTPESAVGEGVFASEGQGLVSVENVEFYSMCEHHLLPFWGTANVAYFPGEKIINPPIWILSVRMFSSFL